MIKQQMKIGPKGQVVIPKVFREYMGVGPGSTVVFELKKEGILIENPSENVVEVFDKISKSKKSIEVKPHESYEEEVENRWKKLEK